MCRSIRGRAGPQRGSLDADGDAVVLQSVQQGVHQRLVVEQAVPRRIVEVRCNDGAHAAVALIHGLTLVTHNVAELARVPDLLIEDWRSETNRQTQGSGSIRQRLDGHVQGKVNLLVRVKIRPGRAKLITLQLRHHHMALSVHRQEVNPRPERGTNLRAYDEKVLSENIAHPSEELARYNKIVDQKGFRKELILNALKTKAIDPARLSAVVGRGGLLQPIPSGVYLVNDRNERVAPVEVKTAGL